MADRDLDTILLNHKNRYNGGRLIVFSEMTAGEQEVFENAARDGLLVGANLVGANLDGANLNDANLNGANLYGVNLNRANLNEANLNEANLNRANLNRANLNDANLNRANLNRANLVGANLVGASLDGANLNEANLNRANLVRANLVGASLDGASLDGAWLDGAWLPDTFIDLGRRQDGYPHHAHLVDGKIWIRAGCRSLNIKDARQHWSDHSRGKGCSLCIESLAKLDMVEAIAKARGWFDNVGGEEAVSRKSF